MRETLHGFGADCLLVERELAAQFAELDQLRVDLLRHAEVVRSGFQRNGEQREEIARLVQERRDLESELELVRGRAAELHDTVQQQAGELSELRQLAGEELRAVRQWADRQPSAPQAAFQETQPALIGTQPAPVESQPAPVESQPAPVESQTTAATGIPISLDQTTSDPVVRSVMAQFARLQQDVAQRRRAHR